MFKPIPVGLALLILLGTGFAAWYYPGMPRFFSQAAPEQQHRIEEKELTTPDTRATDGEKPFPEAPLMINTANAVSIPITEQPAAAEPAPVKEAVEAENTLKNLVMQDDTSANRPDMLGKIQIRIGDTLGGMIQKVYGSYTYRYHEAVLSANTRLVNPDRLNVGDTLIFPAVAANVDAVPDTIWWVSLGREPDLDTAVSVLRRKADGPLPLRLLPHWNPEKGLVFHIVLKTCFDNPYAAEEKVRQMVPLSTEQPEVLCLSSVNDLLFGLVKNTNVSSSTGEVLP